MAKGARKCKVAGSAAPTISLVACHDCDLLHRVSAMPPGGVARCSRCQAVLYHYHGQGVQDTSLILVITGMILFILANTLPFLTFSLNGRVVMSTLLTGVGQLYGQGSWELAILVLVTSVLVPLLELVGLLAILLPLRLRRQPWNPSLVLRALQFLSPWAMMDVFLVGVLVAYAKLTTMATIIPGVGIFAFAAQMLVLTWAMNTMDCQEIWRCLETKDE